MALRRDAGMYLGKKTIVNRLNLTRPLMVFHISTLADPLCAQWRKSLCYITVKIRITPRSARVVHAHRSFTSISPFIDLVGESEISRNGTLFSREACPRRKLS